MFQFAEKREVLWPVIIGAPSADGSGRIDEFTIKVRFSLLGRDEAKSMRSGANNEFIASDDFETLLKSHIHGWEGVADENGIPLEYSEGALEALLNVAYIERAFSAGLIQASIGAPSKNSEAGFDGSQE